MKKIILSVAMIAAVAAIAIGATTAFFSDTETSTGNTFTAGAIDLKISNESYVSNQTTGALEYSQTTSWEARDLMVEKFFDFTDLKPGDIGEDTIDFTVINNDAWACAEVTLTSNKDNDCTEPELANDPTCNPNSNDPFNGELAQSIEFIWWSDDGDNVLELDEEASKYYLGPDSISNLLGGDNILQLTLADKYLNFFDRTRLGQGNGIVLPIKGGVTKYIGKAWCFGDMTLTPVAQDNLGKTANSANGPLHRGTGFTCNGANVNNAAQTDSLTADISFYVEQARNNPNFVCPERQPSPTPVVKTLILENKDAGWKVIDETGSPEIQGTLTYTTAGSNFDYSFIASGLTPNGSYSLIYYADQQSRFADWGGDYPGALINTFVADGSGNISLVALSTNLNMDLPATSDWNRTANPDYCLNHNGFDSYITCTGAKIWLVPTSDYNVATKGLTAWNPANYLFETDLIHYDDTDN